MVRKQKRKGLLGRSYGLRQSPLNGLSSPVLHAGVLGAGVILGYVAYPYRENPLGFTLLGAAGSVTAVGILLLIHDLLKDKRVVQA